MVVRAALSALKGRRLPTLGRLCSRCGGANVAAQRRIIEPVDQLIYKRETETQIEVEKALRTGDVFIKHRLLENLPVSSTVKEGDLSHNDKPIFRCMAADSQKYTVLSLEDDVNLSRKYDIIPPSPYSSYNFCSSTCYGVFIFRDGINILLWNPTTNESKILPQFEPYDAEDQPPGVTKCLGYVTCGLWVDDKSQDYKVLRLIEWRYETDGWHTQPKGRTELALYSLKTDSWKEVSCSEFYGFMPYKKTLINGVCYMHAMNREINKLVILTFDFYNEIISYIPLPFTDFRCCDILDYNGLLSVVSAKYVGTDEWLHEHWVMRNGSWCKLFLFHTFKSLHPVGFLRNCELLFFECLKNPRGVLVFDYATGKSKHLDHYGYRAFELIPFSKSFVKLNGAMEIEDQEQEKEKDGRTIQAPLMA